MAVSSEKYHTTGRFPRFNGLLFTTFIAASFVALPIIVVCSFVIFGDSDSWDHLLDTLLSRYAFNSLVLSVLVAIGVMFVKQYMFFSSILL